jgi:hypothetical protein
MYYVITTILMGYASSMVFLQKKNIWAYNLLPLLTVLFFCYYFFYTVGSIQKRKFIGIIAIINILYFFGNVLFGDVLNKFDSLGYSLLSISIAIMVFFYFHTALKKISELVILRDFDFWISSSFLLYFLAGFFIFTTYFYLTDRILSTYTSRQRDLLTILWGVHNLLLFVSALIAVFSYLWINYRKK